MAWSADGSFVWYVGPAAINQIQQLCQEHPELNLELIDARVDVKNGFDTNLKNDIITVNPGRLSRR